MEFIDDIAGLEALYGTPGEASVIKVTPHLTEEYRRWIAASRFLILSTIGPEGTDASPRGDDGPVVEILDAGTVALPDWRGNNRMDSLRNIVRDPRVSLMFMVPGSTNVIRVNGRARVTADEAMRARFERQGALPRTVVIVRIEEVYSQCARAILRARLWTAGDESEGLPTVGDMLAGIKAGFDGAGYDADWPGRAAATMW
ncbi:pyridoxamine 5'-phosphate oxidase family protein [Pseudoroseicyclus sp. CXY001]|uniref:pyridoxamine 5'-phosphate oxidase family protein n=1 Tax=Pseudoroseicyclus sp. CXY001 TaxID=3242492 RepID=UPI00358DAC16